MSVRCGAAPSVLAHAGSEPSAPVSPPDCGIPSVDGKEERGFWASRFPVHQSHHSQPSLEQTLGTDSVTEIPDFKAGLGEGKGGIADRKWCGCVGAKEGFLPL